MVRWSSIPRTAGATSDAGPIPGLGRSPGGNKASHLGVLAGTVPWTEEPRRRQRRWPWSDTTAHTQRSVSGPSAGLVPGCPPFCSPTLRY